MEAGGRAVQRVQRPAVLPVTIRGRFALDREQLPAGMRKLTGLSLEILTARGTRASITPDRLGLILKKLDVMSCSGEKWSSFMTLLQDRSVKKLVILATMSPNRDSLTSLELIGPDGLRLF